MHNDEVNTIILLRILDTQMAILRKLDPEAYEALEHLHNQGGLVNSEVMYDPDMFQHRGS